MSYPILNLLPKPPLRDLPKTRTTYEGGQIRGRLILLYYPSAKNDCQRPKASQNTNLGYLSKPEASRRNPPGNTADTSTIEGNDAWANGGYSRVSGAPFGGWSVTCSWFRIWSGQ